MKKKTILIALLLIITGMVYAIYLYEKPSKNVRDSETELSFLANELIDSNDATTTLTNKVIEVTGDVTFIEKNGETAILVLNDGVKCELKGLKDGVLKVGQQIKIKGIYSGFDELMNEISLNKCHIVE